MTAIRIKGVSYAPCVEGMGRPGSALGCFFVKENTNARRDKRYLVEVEEGVELGPDGELWMESWALKQAQGDRGLGHKAIPEVKREVLVHAAKVSDEMFLGSSDISHGRVAALDVEGARVGSRYFRH